MLFKRMRYWAAEEGRHLSSMWGSTTLVRETTENTFRENRLSSTLEEGVSLVYKGIEGGIETQRTALKTLMLIFAQSKSFCRHSVIPWAEVDNKCQADHC